MISMTFFGQEWSFFYCSIPNLGRKRVCADRGMSNLGQKRVCADRSITNLSQKRVCRFDSSVILNSDNRLPMIIAENIKPRKSIVADFRDFCRLEGSVAKRLYLASPSP